MNHLDACDGGEWTMAVKDLLNHRVALSVGPDKQLSGTVLLVGDDYLAVEEDHIGTVMFPIEHVKYLCASSTPAADQRTERSQLSDTPPAKLIDALRTLKGTVVRLEGGGWELTDGYLVDVMDEYLILVVVPEGMLVFPVCHLHMLVPTNAVIRPEFLTWATEILIDLPNGSRFIEALNSETGKVIRLGRGGPDDMSGILRSAHEDFVEMVISPHEEVYIPTHHVKAFSRIPTNDCRFSRASPTTSYAQDSADVREQV